MIEKSLSYLAQQPLAIRLEDTGADSASRLLYDSEGEASLDKQTPGDGLAYQREIMVADRRWQVALEATPELVGSYASMQSWFFLVAALLFTTAASGYVGVSRNREIRVAELVRTRTSELSDAKRLAVRHAEELTVVAAKAEEASIAKGHFLANMSHEIRTPMNGVISVAELLRETPLDEVQHDYVETIRSSGDALLAVINDILDFSKIESGEFAIEVRDFDLRTIMEEASEVGAVRAHSKGLDFAMSVAPTVPRALRGDPSRLRQILINLAGNAAKFTDSGEVYVSVTVDSERSSRVLLRFEVQDTGIGIAPGRRREIFESFQQGDASTTRRFGGTGLGLAISKRLAEIMGGSIGVESAQGVGSTFWFTVLFELQQIVRPDPAPDSAQEMKVLVVDPSANSIQALAHSLDYWGLAHSEATDLAAAMEQVRRAQQLGHPFNVALVDIRLLEDQPGSGCITIDAGLLPPETALVVMTPLGSPDPICASPKNSHYRRLTKPIREKNLLSYLSERASVSQPTAPSEETPAAEERRKIRVLVAEDNPVNQKVATFLLVKKFHFQADVVANGIEAVEALKLRPYDIVLMDCQMPEMDGFEAARQIRKTASGALDPTIPIVAATASVMPADRGKCIEAGMNDYVAKPLKADELLQVIERNLNHKVA